MGCAFCIPKAEGTDLSFYFPDGVLPDDIVQVTPESPPETLEEFIEGLSAAFCGTDVAAPEGSTSWAYDGSNAYTQPLPKEVTEKKAVFEERAAFYRWSVKFSFTQMARHGGCFALRDSEKQMCAFIITLPPSDRALYHMGLCEYLHILSQLDATPTAYTSGESAERLMLLDKTMTKMHDEGTKDTDGTRRRHIYIAYIGTQPTLQGKGHARRLMGYLTAAADHHQVPIHLESAGTRMERFWDKHGFTVKKHYAMEYSGIKGGEKQSISFQPDGLPGFSSCFREPKKLD